MDKMAAAGVTFTQAYSTNPICTPSRASVFTGVHPLVHQVTCHQNRAPHNLPQLSEILAENGYYTAVVGHYEYARDLNRGWHQQVYWRLEGHIRDASDYWFAQGRDATPPACGTMARPPELGHAHAVTDRAILMLEQIQAADAPFFLHVPYMEPHPPYFAHPPYDKLIDPASLPLPDQGADEGRPAWQFRAREEFGTAKITPEHIRKLVAVYYGMIAYANDQMQRLYDALAVRGMLENTWVIVGSDHGDYAGEKGLFNKSESLYECLLHVPLIISAPANVRVPRGVKTSHLVELTDLFPTILQMAGIDVPEYSQGKDLVAWLDSGPDEPLHDCVFAQAGDYHGFLKNTVAYGGIPESARHAGLLQGARTGQFAYVCDPDYGDEAYDLRADPKELSNLLNRGRGEKPAEIAELRRRVEQWRDQCLRLRDELGVVPGYRGFDEGWE